MAEKRSFPVMQTGSALPVQSTVSQHRETAPIMTTGCAVESIPDTAAEPMQIITASAAQTIYRLPDQSASLSSVRYQSSNFWGL
jgi:hypothetical protein